MLRKLCDTSDPYRWNADIFLWTWMRKLHSFVKISETWNIIRQIHLYILTLKLPLSKDFMHKSAVRRINLWRHTWLVFTSVSFHNASIKPHVSDCHPVLRQCPCLVRADGWCWPKGFHSLQVLHQTILFCHTLCSQCQTHLKDHKNRTIC